MATNTIILLRCALVMRCAFRQGKMNRLAVRAIFDCDKSLNYRITF